MRDCLEGRVAGTVSRRRFVARRRERAGVAAHADVDRRHAGDVLPAAGRFVGVLRRPRLPHGDRAAVSRGVVHHSGHAPHDRADQHRRRASRPWRSTARTIVSTTFPGVDAATAQQYQLHRAVGHPDHDDEPHAAAGAGVHDQHQHRGRHLGHRLRPRRARIPRSGPACRPRCRSRRRRSITASRRPSS